MSFKSTHTIFTSEYNIVINPSEYNSTSNPTIRKNIPNKAKYHTELYENNLTSSDWSPFMNTIGFYRDDEVYPSMVARYSKPVQMRDDMTLIFKVRMDF